MSPPPHKPTDEQRRMVGEMAGCGVRWEDIATIIGISPNTLNKYYRLELDTGKATANAKVTKTLFQKAIAGDTASCIYWTKSQMGWSERSTLNVQHLDANGNPTDPSRLHVTVELLGDAAPVRADGQTQGGGPLRVGDIDLVG